MIKLSAKYFQKRNNSLTIEKRFYSASSGEKKPQREPSLEASMKQIHQTGGIKM